MSPIAVSLGTTDLSVRHVVVLVVLATALIVAVRLLFRSAPATFSDPPTVSAERTNTADSGALRIRRSPGPATPDAASASSAEGSQEVAYVRGPGGVAVVLDARSRVPGYRVTVADKNGLFAVGDLITHIDGSPVELSPAGSELLLIALSADPSRLTIERQR